MLPSILNIVREYNVPIDERTKNKKEVRAVCPFCDAKHKHHLSLNLEKNVFKCWNCQKRGGVLYLEQLLSGKSYDEVRAIYFGSKNANKNVHPAYKLSPEQLEVIGWRSVKRENFHSFNRSGEQVLKDWEVYRYEELVKNYALFLLIANYPIQSKRKELYVWFLDTLKSSKIEDLRSLIESEYKESNNKLWAIKAKEIARIAYDAMKETGELNNLFVYVLLAIEMAKIKNAQSNKKQDKVPV